MRNYGDPPPYRISIVWAVRIRCGGESRAARSRRRVGRGVGRLSVRRHADNGDRLPRHLPQRQEDSSREPPVVSERQGGYDRRVQALPGVQTRHWRGNPRTRCDGEVTGKGCKATLMTVRFPCYHRRVRLGTSAHSRYRLEKQRNQCFPQHLTG